MLYKKPRTKKVIKILCPKCNENITDTLVNYYAYEIIELAKKVKKLIKQVATMS